MRQPEGRATIADYWPLAYSAYMRIAILLAVLTASSIFAADEGLPYDMTNYVVGFLRKGPNSTSESTPETRKIMEGHLANIRKMAAAGKLAVAGPFTDNGDLRGIFIFKNTTMEEAKALVAADPAVKSGRLVLELHPWYSAAGLRSNGPKDSSRKTTWSSPNRAENR